MPVKVSGSTVARKYATREWGSPDSQKAIKIPHTLYAGWFSTPGHGGLVIVATDHLSESVARAKSWGASVHTVIAYQGLTKRYVHTKRGSEHWSRTIDTLTAVDVDWSAVDVVTGEEDCEWALALAAFPGGIEAYAATWDDPSILVVRDMVLSTVDRWYPDQAASVRRCIDAETIPYLQPMG